MQFWPSSEAASLDRNALREPPQRPRSSQESAFLACHRARLPRAISYPPVASGHSEFWAKRPCRKSTKMQFDPLKVDPQPVSVVALASPRSCRKFFPGSLKEAPGASRRPNWSERSVQKNEPNALGPFKSGSPALLCGSPALAGSSFPKFPGAVGSHFLGEKLVRATRGSFEDSRKTPGKLRRDFAVDLPLRGRCARWHARNALS